MKIVLAEVPHGDRLIAGADQQAGIAAEALDMGDFAADRAGCADPRIFGTEPEGDAGAGGIGQEFHGRRAEKTRDKAVVGVVLEIHRAAGLFDAPVMPDDMRSASVVASA